MLKFRKTISGKAGFTLIELLITIFLVSVGLVGVLSFFNSSLQSNFEAKNELIAAGLAQEGTELVRSIVDYQYLNGSSWYSEITNKKDATDPEYCSSIDRDVLFGENFKCRNKTKKTSEVVCFDSTKGVYHQQEKGENCPSGETKTDFTRKLTIRGEDVNGGGIDLETGDCLNIVASVTWNERETKSTDIICKPRQ